MWNHNTGFLPELEETENAERAAEPSAQFPKGQREHAGQPHVSSQIRFVPLRWALALHAPGPSYSVSHYALKMLTIKWPAIHAQRIVLEWLSESEIH